MTFSTLRAALVALAAALFAAACNPVPPELRLNTLQAFTPEWCQAAKELPNHGGSLTNVGKCHERGVSGFPADRNVYVFYYTQGARWGDPDAGASLARLGEPVPDNDLQRERQAAQERQRNIQTLANALRPTPSPPRAQPAAFGQPSFGARPMAAPSGGNFSRSVNESVNQRRVCTNNVCRTERTVCRNGACTTQVLSN